MMFVDCLYRQRPINITLKCTTNRSLTIYKHCIKYRSLKPMHFISILIQSIIKCLFLYAQGYSARSFKLEVTLFSTSSQILKCNPLLKSNNKKRKILLIYFNLSDLRYNRFLIPSRCSAFKSSWSYFSTKL